MSRAVPNTLRAAVAKRASFRCEYCRVHQTDMVFTFQADHIISRKHGGLTVFENLAMPALFATKIKVLTWVLICPVAIV
jgi:5-methylcytosine-specific restriction endonuclease McrA